MSAIYPVFLMFATAWVWILTVRQSSRLIELFWQRLPKVAEREIPGTFDRHPEKVIFFFRRRAVKVLRGDRLLWKQRQHFLLLVTLSALVPMVGFLMICVVAFIQSWQ